MIIKFLSTFLILVSVYFGWWGATTGTLLWLGTSLFAFVAAVGLFLDKVWSQYLWHALSLAIIASWAYTVASVAMAGWPYETILETFISLIPGLLLVGVFAGGSVIVYKHFRAA